MPNRHAHFLRLAASLALTALPLAAQAPQEPALTPVRLPAAEVAKLADEARRNIPAQLADGFELTLWAPTELVTDPIGLDVDADGTVYVVGSARSGMPTDIREHPDWVPEVHTLRTHEDLRQFFRRHLAPDRSAQNTWLPDRNQDGSHDWRDMLTYKERIYRIRDTDADGRADESLVVFEGFADDPADDIVGGVLAHKGDLYVTAAPDLWRLRDTNGDGVMDEKTSLSHGYSIHPAYSGHDMSGVMIGPDGRLYWKIGDIGLNVVDRTGRRWAYPNQGAILRSEIDGTGFEVFATGLRNTQEFDFDEFGNLISVDNDGDHRGESERVVYITYGSDAGWRTTWQYGKYTDRANNRYNVWMDEGLFRPRFEGQAAYIVPPVASYHSGPSGFVYNPGAALSDRWRGHFFVSSYTGSAATARVYAFRLAEDGAGFSLASDTEVMRGVLAPGMKVGPDGALYLSDWIRGWEATGEGRVWRLDTPAAASRPLRADVRKLLLADLTGERATRLRDLLGHRDRRVRQRAQFELARRGDVETLAAAARSGEPRLARIHAMWGIAQLVRRRDAEAARLLPFLKDADAEIRAQAARLLGDVLAARGAAQAPATDSTTATPDAGLRPIARTTAAQAIAPLLADSTPRARFFAAEALGRIGYRPAVPAIVAMLEANDDRDVHLRHAGSLALASIGDAAAIAALADHASRAVRLAAVVALRRLRDAGLARFVQDRDELVVTEAARAVNDEGGVPAALPALAALADAPPFTSEPLVRRILNANLRVGSAEAARRVGAFAARTGAPEPLRIEAVNILGVWAGPSPLDRVDGAQLAPPAPRDAEAARAAVLALVDLLAADETATSLKTAIIDAVARLDLNAATPALLARLERDRTPAVRVSALRALEALGAAEIQRLLPGALADPDPAVRMAAIGAIRALPLSDAEKADYLVSVVGKGSTGEQQSALDALGGLQTAAAADRIGTLLDRVAGGTLAPEVMLDLFEAARANGAEPLLARLDRLGAGRKLDNLATTFPAALTRGGTASRGRQVALEHEAAQCVRCHTIGKQVSTVGPPLDGIGSRLADLELLEAIVNPSARIAPGFGMVAVTLRNGRRVEGVLHEETGTTVIVEDGASVRHRLDTSAIASRTNLPSAMPPMGAVLTPAQLRDVVAYLGTLK